MLASASEHYRRQQRITAAGLRAARRARRNPLRLVASVSAFQVAAAQDAAASVPQMLAEQGARVAAEGSVNPGVFAGIAIDGRPLREWLDRAASDAAFDMIVSTTLQDTARLSAGVAIAARPTVGWVRMVNPPCCLRCAQLAGKWFRYNQGFQRHPRCDCRHVPAVEDHPADIATSPDALVKSGQVTGLTKPEARALEDGADLQAVANARRNLWLDSPMHPSLRRIYAADGDPVPALRAAGYLF
jgi:hypothetical protein